MRNESVTIAKAIAIMLMVLAHSCFSDYANKWINMFHMPLFFFFAGYCFKDKYLATPKAFVKRRIQGLYKPFIKWSLIFLLLHNVFFELNIYNDEYGFRGMVSQSYELKDFVKKSISIITRMGSNEQLLGGYWFLRSLFCGSLIGYGIIRYVNNNQFVWGGEILLIITMLLALFDLQVPYFNISARETFVALFFISGYFYKKNGLLWHHSIWIIPLGIISVTVGNSFWQSSLLKFEWWMVPFYSVTAVSGLLAVYSLSRLLENRKGGVRDLLVYVGNNTLTILTWHLLCFKLVSLTIILVNGIPIAHLAEFPVIETYSTQGWFIPYTIVGICMPLIISRGATKIFNRLAKVSKLGQD